MHACICKFSSKCISLTNMLMNNVVPKHSGSKVYSAKKYKGPRKQHIKQFSTLIIIRNVPKQHIRMISEGSCEDRSNDC